jgi:hypothetical protein
MDKMSSSVSCPFFSSKQGAGLRLSLASNMRQKERAAQDCRTPALASSFRSYNAFYGM